MKNLVRVLNMNKQLEEIFGEERGKDYPILCTGVEIPKKDLWKMHVDYGLYANRLNKSRYTDLAKDMYGKKLMMKYNIDSKESIDNLYRVGNWLGDD